MADGLNAAQESAVRHRGGPLLVLAGPGSGKTRVITYRARDLIARDGVDSSSILAITFTKKAAREIKNRLNAMLGHGRVRAMTVSTFHALGAMMLREHYALVGLAQKFTIYDEDDQLTLLKQVIRRSEAGQTLKDPKIQEICDLINNRKDGTVVPASEGDASWDPQIEVWIEEYEKILRQCNSVDFADLLWLPAKIMREHPDVQRRYQERFQHLLVDEFQDCNARQYELVRLLGPSGSDLCVVGDDDQLIYGWRGASVDTILRFERDYPGTKVVKLEENYRSASHILQAASGLIQNNKKRYGKDLWTSQPPGSEVLIYEAPTCEHEASTISTNVSVYRGKGTPLREMAVFYRANWQSRTIEDHLRRRGIPYTIHGGLSFYQRSEVKDVIAGLRLIANPSSDIDLRRLIMSKPSKGIGDKTLERVYAFSGATGIPVTEVLTDQGYRKISDLGRAASGKLGDFSRMLDRIKLLKATQSLRMQTQDLMNITGILRYYEESKDTDLRARDKYENLLELVQTAAEMDARYETEVEDKTKQTALDFFLEQVAIIEDAANRAKDKEHQEDRVMLMTFHASKGLEFDFVMMTGLEDNVFPTQRSIGYIPKMEEERRLFYVGMTRARKYLLMSFARERRIFGKAQYNPPSRFLREVPKQHYKWLTPPSKPNLLDGGRSPSEETDEESLVPDVPEV